MPDHDVPLPNTFAKNEPMMDVFRSRTELVETLNRYRENLRWYVEERNRLITANESLRAEVGLERIKLHQALGLGNLPDEAPNKAFGTTAQRANNAAERIWKELLDDDKRDINRIRSIIYLYLAFERRALNSAN